MNISIEPASPETRQLLAAWRYPPPYDFYDGDAEPMLNPERYFEARDEEGELLGFYYFEPKLPDLDYGLGLRPELTGRGLGLEFFLPAWPLRASATDRGTSSCTSRSSMRGHRGCMSGRGSESSRLTCGRSTGLATFRS